MRINTNVSAMIANHHLNNTDNMLSKSMQRLSSGKKLNRAEDDSASIAIAKRLHTQINSIGQTGRNGNDGVSVVQTAEGALNEVHSILQRMRELAVQGATGTNSDDDRKAIQEEVEDLEKEIIRVTEQTQFSSITLLNGNLDRRSYCTVKPYNSTTQTPSTGTTQTQESNTSSWGKVISSSDSVPADVYGIEVKNGNVEFAKKDNAGSNIGFTSTAKISKEGDYVTVTDNGGFHMVMRVSGDGQYFFDVTDMGTMPIQIGIAEGQVLDIRIPEINLETLGLLHTNFSTQENCESAISDLDKAISYISEIRGGLGAYQNRLESAVRSIEVAEESVTSSLSRIEDTDMAEEMTYYTQMNVLTQAGISVLTQANERPQMVLQLLQ